MSWKESEIIANLFVGDLQDAQKFDGVIINVLPDLLDGEPKHAYPFAVSCGGQGLAGQDRCGD